MFLPLDLFHHFSTEPTEHMKMTPKPQTQPATTPAVPDLAATVADLLDLVTKLVLRSVEHSNNFTTLSGWIAEQELHLRALDGKTEACTTTGLLTSEVASLNNAVLLEALERIRTGLDYHFNRVTVRLDQ